MNFARSGLSVGVCGVRSQLSSHRNINKTTRIAAAADAKGADGRPWCAHFLHLILSSTLVGQELFSGGGGASSLFKTVAKRLRARGCAASKTAPPTNQPTDAERKLVPESVESCRWRNCAHYLRRDH
jgi:hypothetical protein